MCVLLFFFKQKTAYEMRISDWSSDVCSSDLEHFQAIEDLQRIGTVDLTNYPGLIDPTVPRGGTGITKQPAQLAVLWFVGRKLRVDRIGVFVHLAVHAQEFHGEDAIGDLATEELDRVLGHSLTRDAEIDSCCEDYRSEETTSQ